MNEDAKQVTENTPVIDSATLSQIVMDHDKQLFELLKTVRNLEDGVQRILHQKGVGSNDGLITENPMLDFETCPKCGVMLDAIDEKTHHCPSCLRVYRAK
ncbi:uncharacterized protein Dvar_19320 [Desulfosarcina variabilis str. Montpellier]|uniref:hypothetical protein n=1 Tax=Desulfosarcina variabilis TaxID=2300 RepID=UPI003AFA7680